MGPGGGGGGGLRDGSRVVEPADARWRRLLASDVREYGLQRPHPCLQVKGTVNSKLIFHIIICYSKIIFYRMSYYGQPVYLRIDRKYYKEDYKEPP